MIGIHHCGGLEKDSVSIQSSSIRADIQLKNKNKDIVWKNIKNLSVLKPDTSVIVAGNKAFVEYIRSSDDFYSIFDGHLLHIRPMTVAEIYHQVIDELKRDVDISKPLLGELEKYIYSVYNDKSLLKKDVDFVDDLVNKVLVNHYTHSQEKSLDNKSIPSYKRPLSYEEISKLLNDRLVGQEKVKKQFRNLYLLSQDQTINNKRLHFAFMGSPGTGKTTVAQLTAKLLHSMGLIKTDKLVSICSTDVISSYRGESALLMKEKISEAYGGVLFIDEAYFLTSNSKDKNDPQKQVLDVLLTEMENHSEDLTVIFAGYTDEITELLRLNPGLSSRVPYKFQFEDYSTEELFQIFKRLAKTENMIIADEAEEILFERIEMLKAEENYGNARSVANLYQQIKAIWMEKEINDRHITRSDIEQSFPTISQYTNLDDMIGLESIKRELVNFESRVRYLKYLQEMDMPIDMPNMHMMFTGNPGTGKTTVAKRIADCLYRIGVIKTNKLIVAERKDLVDNIIGGTEKKTNALIQKAMHGVLFIDEAYSLYKPDSPRDYGSEAIATLITAMETYKSNLIVIFAGYQEEMNLFINSNPGISSRIGFSFHFPDYSPEELVKMYFNKMQKNGFKFEDDDVYVKCHALMKYYSESENFGNGRFVDKVINYSINKRSQRPYKKKYNDIIGVDIPDIKEMEQVSPNFQGMSCEEAQSDSLRWRVAVHEVGHALVSIYSSPSNEIKNISINQDVRSHGRTEVYQELEYTEGVFRTSLAVKFGGRSAERIIFGEHSNGCTSDITSAKRLAEYMIEDMAVGEFGVTTPMDLLRDAEKSANKILIDHQDELLKAAGLLLQRGSISGQELKSCLS